MKTSFKMGKPTLYMIAGPNGAGKTTTALRLLPGFLSMHEFVNADEIGRGLNPLNPDGQAILAGRLMLQRIDTLIAAGKSFAFETTGASHAFAEKMRRAKTAGYNLGLVYLWLPDATFAKSRVKLRVTQGGHNIPEDAIERRYSRGLHNLLKTYLPLVDRATIYDGTQLDSSFQDVIAEKLDGSLKIHKSAIWHLMEATTGK